MAGVYTPSEMWAAHKAGAHIVKLFPGAANGAAFVKVINTAHTPTTAAKSFFLS